MQLNSITGGGVPQIVASDVPPQQKDLETLYSSVTSSLTNIKSGLFSLTISNKSKKIPSNSFESVLVPSEFRIIYHL
jgi:hypothetical protein